MNKAKEKALKMYPGYDGRINETEILLRTGFVEGYEQAKKEFVLTWEDIKAIHELAEDVWTPNCNEQECYEEVLQKFYERKKKTWQK